MARVRNAGIGIACAVVLALPLAACGSSKKSSTTTTVKASGSSTTTRVGATGTTTATTGAPVATTAATLPPPVTTAAATPTTAAFKAEPTTGALTKGVKGTRTAAMQTKLRALGYDPGPSDGIFGDKTDAAVKRFQSDKKLQVDGVAGPVTLAAIDSACKSKNAC